MTAIFELCSEKGPSKVFVPGLGMRIGVEKIYQHTVKTGIIESCAMSLRIPYYRKGAKNVAKEGRLSPL